MTKLNTQKGFTLVELAIVMTIIGLLIGGILKGQELMENARVTATIAQVKSYEAATTTFRDSFSAIPGDMPNAQDRIPGCNANCNPAAAGAGDSVVGVSTWGTGGWVAQSGVPPAAAMANPPTAIGSETVLFWTHLLLADLIAGVSSTSINGASAAWGETHPAAKLGGGFVVGFGDGTRGPGAPAGTVGPAGMILALANAPAAALGAGVGQQPMTPARAGQIDRKMDDGRPNGGFVQAYGVAASCFFVAAGGNIVYAENQQGRDCGLLFRIQG